VHTMWKYYLLLACLVPLCVAQCGSYVASDGTVYDLNGLTTLTDYTGTNGGYTYKWNFCQYIKPTDNCDQTPVAQYTPTYCSSLGTLPAVIRDHPEGPKNGVTITYVNQNDPCGRENVPRVSNFVVTCSSTEYKLTSIAETQLCTYEFEILSSVACQVGTTSSSSSSASSSSSSGSTGGVSEILVPLWISAFTLLSILLILVIILIVVLVGVKKAKGYMALSNGQVIEL